MADKIFENNQVTITGEIVSDFQYSHEVFGEGFYMVEVSVNRLSNFADIIPMMISERLIDTQCSYIGQYIRVDGQFRSYNRHEEKKNRLVLSVFVRELEFVDEIPEGEKSNQIFLDGYICKEPIYRKTPLGREIADLLIAVNRSYGKSDYIPCICWGRNARYASGFEIGGHVQVYGRIQSREYVKKHSEGFPLKDYIEERAIDIANYIIDNNATVRQTAKAFGISKHQIKHALETMIDSRILTKICIFQGFVVS